MLDSPPAPLPGIDAAVAQLLDITRAAAGCGAAEVWGGLSAGELMDALVGLHRLANLTCAAEQSLLAHAMDTDAFESFGAASPADLLADRLRLTRSEAHTRVRRATRATPRTTLTGEALPPRHEQVAAAQGAGQLSGEHVDTLTHWLGKLEPHATLAQFAAAETQLVAVARRSSPEAVAARGRELLQDLDPDGPAPRDLERRRSLAARQAADGSGKLSGSLTPEVLAKLLTLLSPLAAPHPQNPQTGERDPRGVGQRQHDAFEELLDRLLQSGDMPAHGGIPLTVIVMMDLDDLLHRTGTARTGFGTTIPVKRLLEQAAELQVVPVITSKVDGIVAYGIARRIASPGQALALIGRDRGCTFPGCCRPAQWTQRHHIDAAVDGGPTDLANLVLVCGFHHRHFGRLGWSVHLEGGHAWWIPPATVDPDRQPLRNLAHDPPDLRTTA